ncbi:ankyrin repeat domain-containing protein [Rhodoferax sp.]|uniref:ankyrin repeat domain-containing protein n=1 Tax=Rhodoferax sp. TaxID=50421 RepID=UPI0032677C37
MVAIALTGCSKKDSAIENLKKMDVAVNQESLSTYAVKGDLETVKLLIDAEVPAGALNRLGKSALVDSAYSGKKDVVAYLLDSKVDVNTTDSTKLTALAAAVANNQEQVVTFLLERKANPNLVDAGGTSPLISAAWLGATNSVKALLANGAELNYRRPSDGISPLKAALAGNHLDAVQMLKTAGATE